MQWHNMYASQPTIYPNPIHIRTACLFSGVQKPQGLECEAS